MTRFLNVPLDVSDVFIMTFMILLDSYMEPTRVGSDGPVIYVVSLKDRAFKVATILQNELKKCYKSHKPSFLLHCPKYSYLTSVFLFFSL